MSVTITILDQVNCHFGGLTDEQIEKVIERTKLPVKGAYMQASFKMKLWDGKESLFDEDGFCYVYMIDEIVDILESIGCDLSDAEIVDERSSQVVSDDIPEIDENFLIDEIGMPLRDIQVTGINKALKKQTGLLDASTSFGKTILCLGLSKALDPYTKTIVVTPTEYLAKQTLEDYQKSNLNVGLLDKNVPVKKREQFIAETDHIIATTKIFYNTAHIFENHHFAVMLDEAHEFGEVLVEKFRLNIGHWQFRIGMSGSLPKKDKLKYQQLKCVVGNGIIDSVKQRELMESGLASNLQPIRFVKTDDEAMRSFAKDNKDDYDYSIEDNYCSTNANRIESLVSFIDSLEENTLILCRSELANRLSKELGIPLIDQNTSVDDRKKIFNDFSKGKGYKVVGTFRTAATGISENNIQSIVGIDMGEAASTILQAIGRGMRLDGEDNTFTLYDVYADLKYGKKHVAARKRQYKNEHHAYDDKNIITLKVHQEEF